MYTEREKTAVLLDLLTRHKKFLKEKLIKETQGKKLVRRGGAVGKGKGYVYMLDDERRDLYWALSDARDPICELNPRRKNENR
jgi:hypothetical protein